MYYRKQWERTLTFPFPSSVADYIKQRIFSVFDKKKNKLYFFPVDSHHCQHEKNTCPINHHYEYARTYTCFSLLDLVYISLSFN